MAEKRQVALKRGMAKRGRSNKVLYIPLDVATANRLSLRSWTALERARAGHGDRTAASALAHATIVTDFLSMAGCGSIDHTAMVTARTGLVETMERGLQSDEWIFSENLLTVLGTVLNEHHRQLREERMAAIVEATEKLEVHLKRGNSMLDLLRFFPRSDTEV
ncbi:Fis family transcriptional regulator [Caballeronia arationis]|uniref:hypothetical protein n=1 Tax=Caballeronia arationis TaxID=1777142 RepID=UPI00074CED41|nr:hypothetical protein [Caballeronia arationis]SAK87143.1 Fis family transcriptional regulator [Caballeronia arationis]